MIKHGIMKLFSSFTVAAIWLLIIKQGLITQPQLEYI